MVQNENSAKRVPRRNGELTPEGRRNQVASRISYGVRATTPVLVGIEDPQEWRQFLAGFTRVWDPVGQHEYECVAGIAGGYWRLRRLSRFVTETTVNRLLAAAVEEPLAVRRQIEQLIGAPVVRHTLYGQIELDEGSDTGNGNTRFQPSTPAWWERILHGPDDLELSRAETSWILEHVTDALLQEDGDNDDDSDDDEVEDCSGQLLLPTGLITLGALRAQLMQLQQMRGSTEVDDILLTGYKDALEQTELNKLALVQAQRFISSHLILSEPTSVTASTHERQILCAISRHMNTLERLQARRAGQPVPLPVSLDVNLTATREDSP